MYKRILMLVAPNRFRDEEYFDTKEILENEGYGVITICNGVKIAKSKFGHIIDVDKSLYEVNVDDYDALVIVGGSGSLIYKNDVKVHKLIRDFERKNKLIAARCIAPKILAYSDVLRGRKATIWNKDGFEHTVIKNFGGRFVDTDLVRDHNIITGGCVHSSKEFGKNIIRWMINN